MNDIEQALHTMSRQLQQRLAQRPANPPLMVGIHSGGVWVARRLHRMLDLTTPLAMLNISFYRDDFTRVGINPQVRPSDMPLSVDDRDIILVDDVLYTGRTVRAALNELFDYGRPASITLAVLVDRGGRELPIQAAVTGMTLQLPPGQHVKLKGPEPMTLSVEGAP